MLRHRVILLVLSTLLVVGSLSGTLGYALHLRSDGYRRATEQDLSAWLGMPVEIGRVVPLSFSSSQFADIRTWLPRRRAQVFACERATWREILREGVGEYALDIRNGWLLVGTGGWTREDYEVMLRSGFGHDFAAIGLSAVHLDGIDLKWEHPDFRLSAKAAVGEILFDKDGRGRASLVSRRLNDYASAEPIHIRATFLPGVGLRFEEVVLEVPSLPLAALGLERLLGGEVTTGTFAGRVVYREDGRQTVEVGGAVEWASLEELTRQVIGGPFQGTVYVKLDQAEFVDRELCTLRFHGQLADVRLADLLPMFGRAGLLGRASLDIGQFDFADGRIRRLSLSGDAIDLPLDEITRTLGFGEITGRLDVRVHSLLVVDDKLRGADIDLIATPPPDGPGTIDRQVIQMVSQQLLGLDVSAVLPDQVEYTRLGAKLLISGDRLTVRGTHGPRGKTILTVRVVEREWNVLDQPDRSFEVGDLMAMLRGRVEQYDYRQIEEWWGSQHRSSE